MKVTLMRTILITDEIHILLALQRSFAVINELSYLPFFSLENTWVNNGLVTSVLNM